MASPVPQKDDVERWTVEQVAAWLRQMELTDCCEFFLRKGIDGRSLMELTEEGLVLWGRDVSIRNRKKIMKLVRLIENQYLISIGKLQQCELPRPPLATPQNVLTNERKESLGDEEFDDNDDGGFGPDEFDDYDEDHESALHDENHSGYATNSDHPRRPPSVPGSAHPSHGSQTPRSLGPKPNASSSTVRSSNQQREWPPKKPTEFPSTHNNNQSETSAVQPRAPSWLSELNQKINTPVHSPSQNTDNVYEVVENPPGTFPGNESHSDNLPGQGPPPLPQRNQDGRDSSWSGANQQPSTIGSNVPLNRPVLPNRPLPTNRTSSRSGALNNNQSKTPHTSQQNPQDWSPQKGNVGGGHTRPVSGPRSLPPQLPLQHHTQSNVNNGGGAPLGRAPPPPLPPPLQSSTGGLQHSVERVPIGDGDSIELTPLYRSLLDRPYFHVISRTKSKQLLENADDGVFLIRPSTRSSDPLTLCLQYSGRTYNINIRQRRDTLYALGSEKVNEMTFGTIDDIVHTHTNEPIRLKDGDRVTLSTSPGKGNNIYVQIPNKNTKKY